jgi:hypothetical protein
VERERDRSDEVLRATLDLIGANETAARAESELVVVGIQADGERTAAMRGPPGGPPCIAWHRARTAEHLEQTETMSG